MIWLLAHGADKEIKDIQGRTAEDLIEEGPRGSTSMSSVSNLFVFVWGVFLVVFVSGGEKGGNTFSCLYTEVPPRNPSNKILREKQENARNLEILKSFNVISSHYGVG